jgi:ABC-type branched-subunit amino acid transport system substrate-binding protein
MIFRFLVLAAALSVAASATAADVPTQDIAIGIEAPSALSPSGAAENLGMRLVMREVNAGGGINGHKLTERSYARTKTGADGDAEVLANVARLADRDRVLLLWNHGGTASMQIAPFAMARKLPYMFPHTGLLDRDDARYVFTSFPHYDGETRMMYRYLARDRGMKRIAILYDPNAYGRYFRDRLRDLAQANGYAVTGEEPVNQTLPADLTAEMRRLRDQRPDAIVMALYPPQAKRVMEAKAKLDWKDVRMVSTGPLTDEEYLNVPGGFADGTLGLCYYPDPNHSDVPGVLAYRRLMARYFPGEKLNRYSLYGYAFGQMVMEGLRRAGPNPTRESFIDAMETIKDWDSGGILPPVSFSKTDHHAQRAGFVCELRDGRFAPLSGWITP